MAPVYHPSSSSVRRQPCEVSGTTRVATGDYYNGQATFTATEQPQAPQLWEATLGPVVLTGPPYRRHLSRLLTTIFNFSTKPSDKVTE